ncbi:hypothetical protein M3221_13630 [Domibacillus indicus]|uniref:hypothetical protein n=1 Tax=Domibacillus indicus TaxID=1437523 RepID=UPI00203CAABF|nr:hypothetical protein [Domibacillus indicus]MCM3789441.1 hypothetical protein [Domibacillus indicus]
MTVLLVIAVKPKEGLKPYVLMGADSKSVTRNYDIIDGREILASIEQDENAKKIFKIYNKLLGVTGRFTTGRHQDLINYLIQNSDEETEIEVFAHMALEFCKSITGQDGGAYNFNVLICSSKPIANLITFTMNSVSGRTPKLNYHDVFEENYNVIFAGEPNLGDLQDEFVNRINPTNLNLSLVKKAANDYLRKSAARYPETCNQNIQFEFLK